MLVGGLTGQVRRIFLTVRFVVPHLMSILLSLLVLLLSIIVTLPCGFDSGQVWTFAHDLKVLDNRRRGLNAQTLIDSFLFFLSAILLRLGSVFLLGLTSISVLLFSMHKTRDIHIDDLLSKARGH